MKLLTISLMLLCQCASLVAAELVEVSTDADDGDGSLRQALLDVDAGGLVTFESSLSGQVISLTSGHLLIDKSLTIDGSALDEQVTISGSNESGVILLENLAELELRNLVVADAFFSGGIVMVGGGNLVMEECSLLNNHSEHSGGGVYVGEGSSLKLDQCLIEGNSADRGGGIYNFGLVEVDKCTFRNNEGRVEGGGFYNRGEELVQYCLFVGNTSRNEGGAMWLRRDTVLIGCTIVENEAPRGGAIYCSKDLNLHYCTLVQNSASNDYAAFYVANSLQIWNSIVSDNQQVGTNTEINDTLISNSSNSFFDDGAPLEPLGDYGGPTLTMRPTADETGLIDMGDENPSILKDGRGELRKFGDASDIGAVERQSDIREELLTTPDGDPDGDSVVTLLEVAMGRDPLIPDVGSARRLKIDRSANSAKITFGIDPELADEIELTLLVTRGIEGLEVLLTDEMIRAIPLNDDGVLEYDLVLDARVKFYRLDAKFVPQY